VLAGNPQDPGGPVGADGDDLVRRCWLNGPALSSFRRVTPASSNFHKIGVFTSALPRVKVVVSSGS